jgi:hypothetical protein
VKEQVAQLDGEDWKGRDRAEAQLVGMGPAIAGTLKQLRNEQSPEGQQRIDSVLKQLEKQAGEARPTAPGAAVPGNAGGPQEAAQPVQQQQIEIINGPGR